MGKILKTGIIQQHNVASIDDNRARLAAKIRRLAADGAKLIVNQELHIRSISVRRRMWIYAGWQ